MNPVPVDKLLADAGLLLAAIGAVVGGLWTLVRWVTEFRLQGAQKRADLFRKMRAEFYGNANFNEIRRQLERDDPALATRDLEHKRAYLVFFEEIALLRNSGLLDDDLARYMFGYYAVKCLRSEHFWVRLRKSRKFWGVFISFAETMQQCLHEQQEVADHALHF